MAIQTELRTVYFDSVDAPTINGATLATYLRASNVGLVAGSAAHSFSGISGSTWSNHKSRGDATAVAASTTQPTPSGTGYILDDESFTGWIPDYNGSGTNIGSLTFTMSGAATGSVRAHLWRLTPSGVYNRIGELTSVSDTLRGTVTVALSGTLFRSSTFATGDRLYIELLFLWSGATAQTRTITLAQDSGAYLTFQVVLADSLRPVNDHLSEAHNLGSGTTGSFQVQNAFASYEPGETVKPIGDTDWNNQDGPGSLWWQYTVPSEGIVDQLVFDTVGSYNYSYSPALTINTRMTIYTGTSYADLVEVAYNDNQLGYSDNGAQTPNSNTSTNKWSKVTIFDPAPGTHYFIQVSTQTYYFSGNGSDTALGSINCRVSARARGVFLEPTADRLVAGSYLNYTTGFGSTRFGQVSGAFGYWEMWQSFGSPDPPYQPGAYGCVSAHAHAGAPSAALNYNTPDQGGWTDAGFGWSEAPSTPAQACAPLPAPGRIAEPGDYPGGIGLLYNGLCTGGLVGSSAGSVMVGGTLEAGSQVSRLRLDPGQEALKWEYWAHPSDPKYYATPNPPLPAGAYGVVYEREYADIVSLRVRLKAGVGNGSAPAHKPSFVAELRHIPSVVGAAPAYGFFEYENETEADWGQGTYLIPRFVFTSHSASGNFPLVGTVTVSGTTLTMTQDWYQLAGYSRPEYHEVGEPYAPGQFRSFQRDTHWLQLTADFIKAHEAYGYADGVSYLQLVENLDVEFELVLRPPPHAFLYEQTRTPPCELSGSGTLTCQGVPVLAEQEVELDKTRRRFMLGR